MPLRPIYGHEPLRARLTGATLSGRLPQATLFVGPAGVGKQRLALWLAQAIVCTAEGQRPCGSCNACRQVLAAGHPDVHWFTPIERPKGGDTARQIDDARSLLAVEVAARGKEGLWGRPEGRVGHPLASIRLLQRVVSRTPFAAPRKVVILGDAEWLVVQDASTEAANALLKVLEEPPADTTILVTAEHPQALLPTIRSRLVPLRIPALTEDDISLFSQRELGVSKPKAQEIAHASGGTIGQALRLARSDGLSKSERAAAALLERVRKRKASWVPVALGRGAYGARDDFQPMLDALSHRIRDHVAALADRGDTEALRKGVTALKRVDSVRAETRSNVNPQLALAVLASDLEELL